METSGGSGPSPSAGVTPFEEGVQFHVVSTLGEEFKGEVLAYDKVTECVVFQNIGVAGTRQDLRFFRVKYMKKYDVIGRNEDPQLTIPNLDANFVKNREETAVRQAEIEAEKIGVGVTADAQQIFDCLSRTLPVKWDKTDIIVMDEVRVTGLYMPENVTGGSPAANDRVKKVLEAERRRLEERKAQAGAQLEDFF